jgi:Flp pilus assembly protein CpaB
LKNFLLLLDGSPFSNYIVIARECDYEMKRLKIYKIAAFTLFFVFALAVVTFVVGFGEKVTVLVSKQTLDPNLPLEQQFHKVSLKTIKTPESEFIQESFIRSEAELKGARLRYSISAGRPIPKDALIYNTSSSALALQIPDQHTLFKFADVVLTLPPGIQIGDRLDVIFSFEVKSDEPNAPSKEPLIVSTLIMEDLKIGIMDDASVYLLVTEDQAVKLSNLRQFGSFSLQLPGQKKVLDCEEIQSSLINERNEALSKAKSEEEREEIFNSFESQIANKECVNPAQSNTTISNQMIIDSIKELLPQKEDFEDDNS